MTVCAVLAATTVVMPVNKLPLPTKYGAVMFPDADTTPVTYSPAPDTTTMFPMPPIPIVTLPPALTILTFELPLIIELLLPALMPVSCDPFP